MEISEYDIIFYKKFLCGWCTKKKALKVNTSYAKWSLRFIFLGIRTK